MKTGTKRAIVCFMTVLALTGIYTIILPRSTAEKRTVEEKREYWLDLAKKAWQFYQPGKAVNAQTGLHGAGLDWPYFTEWDLGTYIQASIDARELGLLQDNEMWGFDYRIDKILQFLKTRKLTSNNLPYLNYDSRNGEPYGDTPSFCIDEGKLLMALYNLKCIKPDLAQEIDFIVKVRNNNTDTGLVPHPSWWLQTTDLYCYYAAFAFEAFELDGWTGVSSAIISHIVSQPKVVTYGVELPSAHICTEPLLHTLFEVNPQNQNFTWLVSQIYEAQEARHNGTGYYTAFSEGNTGLSTPSYVYEFVVDLDGSTWKVAPSITPITYLKVAVGFDAIFDTSYTNSMVDYILAKLPSSSSGYQEGVAEDGRVVNNIIDRTNGLIISAARYAINQLPNATPSPTVTSTATATSSANPSASPSSSITSHPTSLSPTPPMSHNPESSTPSISPTSTPNGRIQDWTTEIIAIVAIFAVCLCIIIVSVFLMKRKNSINSKATPDRA